MTIMLDETQLPPQLIEILTGEKIGARVLFAAPGQAATAASDTATASPATPASIIVLDVIDAKDVPTRAEGEAVPPVAGLPTVTLADNGEPSIAVPAGAQKPTTLVAQTLIKGAGAVVASGQQITVQYSGWLFDGTPFDSSWTNGSPFTTAIGSGAVIPGWDQGLVGQTVGSQVLLVIPPDLAYGSTAQGSIPADSTLIFVVDILAAG
jgi:peptidylprolyl isomerase